MSSPWLVDWGRRGQPEVMLVAVPQALGGPSTFRAWPPLLPPAIELHVASFPGRERRIGEPPATRLEALADGVFQAVAADARAPVALFGHSQGALIAFEVARRLEAAGLPLVHLVASGCWAPQNCGPHPGLPPPDADDDAVLASLVAVGGVPAELMGDASMVEVMVRLWRADARVTTGYRYHAGFPPLRAPISAFGGADDPLFPPAGLDAWAVHTTGPFAVRTFPGGHFYLEPHREATVAAVVAALAPV
jgi:surfactin synthase thioesterase subunit